jgi:hypothetical protein
MGSTSFQVRLTDSALNDLHEIDEYWFLRGEPDRESRDRTVITLRAKSCHKKVLEKAECDPITSADGLSKILHA